MAKTRVAVIFGGVSNEHEISLLSATNIINNIPRDRYDVVCIGITKKGRWLLYIGDTSKIATAHGNRTVTMFHAYFLLTLCTKALLRY